ncbi:hypothetical protein HanRHA438_Chr10g0471971 [Helianthus annuus]|nr:hypothetical protein HanRHA438_Chr10g0471971 [Helianthus annuus]
MLLKYFIFTGARGFSVTKGATLVMVVGFGTRAAAGFGARAAVLDGGGGGGAGGAAGAVETAVAAEILLVVVGGVKECLNCPHFFAFVSFSSFFDKDL